MTREKEQAWLLSFRCCGWQQTGMRNWAIAVNVDCVRNNKLEISRLQIRFFLIKTVTLLTINQLYIITMVNKRFIDIILPQHGSSSFYRSIAIRLEDECLFVLLISTLLMVIPFTVKSSIRPCSSRMLSIFSESVLLFALNIYWP